MAEKWLRSVGIQIAVTLDMKVKWSRNQQTLWIALIVLGVTAGHYLISVHFAIAHNILQRLYYIPIIWAAYRFGKRGGAIVAAVSSLLYLPHILITWQMHPEYQVNQVLEVVLFMIFGITFGLLFERKANDQRLIQSYEKLAMFGSLSRSVIRSLKAPIKSLQGMLVMMEPLAKRDSAVESCLSVMRGQLEAISGVRNSLISLVERKKLRLKRLQLSALAGRFKSETALSLRMKEIQLVQKLDSTRVSAHIHEESVMEVLHHLVGVMLENFSPTRTLTVYTGESGAHVWIGVTTKEVRLSSYYLSDLSCISLDHYGDNNLIDVFNTMNNHFGDVRFRRADGDLLEFILVFPKSLSLPWNLRDEPVNSLESNPKGNNQLALGSEASDRQRKLRSSSFFME